MFALVKSSQLLLSDKQIGGKHLEGVLFANACRIHTRAHIHTRTHVRMHASTHAHTHTPAHTNIGVEVMFFVSEFANYRPVNETDITTNNKYFFPCWLRQLFIYFFNLLLFSHLFTDIVPYLNNILDMEVIVDA